MRRRHACIALIAALASGTGPLAYGIREASLAAQDSGLILGRVIDAESGRPVAGALVTITPSSAGPVRVGELTEARPVNVPAAMAADRSLRALTTADGRFVFRDLPAAQFAVLATAPGHIAGAYGRVRPNGSVRSLALASGEKRGDVVIRVWKTGSISGTVVDEHGEPATAVNVRCLRRVIAGGQWRLSSAGVSTLVVTDDRGMYRVANLAPGDYVCGMPANQTTIPAAAFEMTQTAEQSGNPNAAEGYRNLTNSGGAILGASGVRVGDLVWSSSGVSMTRGLPPPPANGTRLMVYPPTYYPASRTTWQATAISLESGEDRAAVNLQIRPVPAVKISGRVTGPDGPGAFLNVSLFPSNTGDIISDTVSEVGGAVTDAAGDFTFLGVPAGQYVVRIKLYPRPAPGAPGGAAVGLDLTARWATVAVNAEADVEGLGIALQPGIRVTGRVVFEGAKPPSPAEVQRLAIRMQSADGRTSSPIALDGRASPDMTFRTAGYAGGRYILGLLATSVPPGWSLKSAMHDGRDISVEPVELAGSDIAGVVITLTDKTATLTGRVTGTAVDLDGAEVIAWPADSTAWRTIGVVARRWRQDRIDTNGAFSLTGLPAGDYYAVALGPAFPNDPQDPRVLEGLIKTATRVTLTDGGSAAVTLDVRTR